MLAFMAQLTLVVAGLSEGKAGLGYAAHVDAGGTSTHYVHNEALCRACQARSLHGLVRPAAPPAIASSPRAAVAIPQLESRPDSPIHYQHSSRAPPFVS
jgi:hypothetical protein